jgi:hypothetical protein
MPGMRCDDHFPYTANARPMCDLHTLSIHFDDHTIESNRAGLGLFRTAQIQEIADAPPVSQALIYIGNIFHIRCGARNYPPFL